MQGLQCPVPLDALLQGDKKQQQGACEHSEIGDRLERLHNVGRLGIGRRRDVEQGKDDQTFKSDDDQADGQLNAGERLGLGFGIARGGREISRDCCEVKARKLSSIRRCNRSIVAVILSASSARYIADKKSTARQPRDRRRNDWVRAFP